MAIIVDKVQKRRDIALSCTELLLEKGIKKLTVSEVAKVAGVSKGSIYDYFENKEDIVFEVIRYRIEQYQKEFESKCKLNMSAREKVFLTYDFILNDNNEYERNQNIYKEYMSINLTSNSERMRSFNEECTIFFDKVLVKIFKEGIEKGELKKESLNFIEGLLTLKKGYLLMMWTEKADVKDDLSSFLNSLFDLIEIKKDC